MGHELTDYFVLDNTRRWIKGTIYEGEAILRCSETMLYYMDNLFDVPIKNINDEKDMIVLHQQYFISSLNQARSWIKESIQYDSSMTSIFNALEEKFPKIKDIRNMNEHDISYYNNLGHKQKDFIENIEGDTGIVSDATSTIITDNGYLIGGRVNLEEVLNHFRELYPVIEDKLNNISAG